MKTQAKGQLTFVCFVGEEEKPQHINVYYSNCEIDVTESPNPNPDMPQIRIPVSMTTSVIIDHERVTTLLDYLEESEEISVFAAMRTQNNEVIFGQVSNSFASTFPPADNNEVLLTVSSNFYPGGFSYNVDQLKANKSAKLIKQLGQLSESIQLELLPAN